MSRLRRGWKIAAVIVSLLVITIVIVASVIDEPLRQFAEAEANDLLPDYQISIGALELHPLTLSVDLHDVVVRQATHPEPPLAAVPHVTADAGHGLAGPRPRAALRDRDVAAIPSAHNTPARVAQNNETRYVRGDRRRKLAL